MESLGERDTRRSRKRITYWRIAMDEIEFKGMYNTACDAAVGVEDEKTKRALLLTLQLINGMMDMLDEMREEEC
jgi:hypothetical protein